MACFSLLPFALITLSRQRIEPIGYDAKANAYWLIGRMSTFACRPFSRTHAPHAADRLWIQRVPPKPPRSLKRKRSSPQKPKPKRATPSDYQDPEPEPEPE